MDPDYLPFHPNPKKPSYEPPAGAVDAHCHVFGPADRFPYHPKRKYTPCDAPKEKLFELRDYLLKLKPQLENQYLIDDTIRRFLRCKNNDLQLSLLF